MNDASSEQSPPTLPMAAGKPTATRFSLERLSSAFARLMGTPTAGRAAAGKPQVAVDGDEGIDDDDAQPVTPRMIVEGMLFVGGADGRTLSSHELARQVRDLTVPEVDAIVVELNERYRDDDAAYEIVGDGDGYRMQLRRELGPMRERIKGRVRAAKLSPAAIEVLSVVAYRQGISGEELNRARGSQSHALLAQLVRRQLVRVERSEQSPRAPRYYTTERFNQLFGIKSPADLPRREDLDDS